MQDDSKNNIDYSAFSDEQIMEARVELWNLGMLEWKLDTTQKKIYHFYMGKTDKTIVINASRRLGKTFALMIIALERCLQHPNSIIKFIQPELGMIRKNVIDEVLMPILLDCPPELQPQFKTQDNTFIFKNGSKIQLAGTDNGNYNKIRGGSCLGENTEIMTPYGPTKIKDIEIGDVVYGYNKDGSVSQTMVTNKFDNGIQEVNEIYIKNQLVGTSTDEHVWLTTTQSKLANNSKTTKQMNFAEINQDYQRIIQSHVDIPCGIIDEPHAYVLGALIGDGCTTRGNKIRISSEDYFIPKQCADILGVKCLDRGDYAWVLTDTLVRFKQSKSLNINHYEDWIRGKTALVKNFDYHTVDNWNRQSCLKLLAGLTDTDGNVYHNDEDSSLEWSYTSINLNLIKNIQQLVFKLFQFRPSIKTRKHKNTENLQYTVRVRNSFYVKEILKQLTPYIALDRKKYDPNMENIIRSKHKGTNAKITKGKRFKEQVYDIQVDNDTHLFLTANGLVTHNCHVAIVDEAGFCSDLSHILKYILVPTTTLTRGRIIFASTTPPTPDHEFIQYMEAAEASGRLIRKTIFDAVEDGIVSNSTRKITMEMVNEIITEYEVDGGVNSDAFRTEYLCEIIFNSDDSVLPEFTKEVQEEVVKNWPRPAFSDNYVAMDVGFTDMTAIIFAYYDYDNAVIVIEDEYHVRGQEVTAKKVSEQIFSIEDKLWTNPTTGELNKPYMRYSDNNLIFINELAIEYDCFFTPTEKQNKASYITKLKTWIKEHRVIINPRCTTLLAHMRGATWDKNKKEYKRNTVDKHHYDFVDALVYLVRNIDEFKSPYPKGYKYAKLGSADDVFYKESYYNNSSSEQYSKLKEQFTPKSSFSKKPVREEQITQFFQKKQKK